MRFCLFFFRLKVWAFVRDSYLSSANIWEVNAGLYFQLYVSFPLLSDKNCNFQLLSRWYPLVTAVMNTAPSQNPATPTVQLGASDWSELCGSPQRHILSPYILGQEKDVRKDAIPNLPPHFILKYKPSFTQMFIGENHDKLNNRAEMYRV